MSSIEKEKEDLKTKIEDLKTKIKDLEINGDFVSGRDGDDKDSLQRELINKEEELKKINDKEGNTPFVDEVKSKPISNPPHYTSILSTMLNPFSRTNKPVKPLGGRKRKNTKKQRKSRKSRKTRKQRKSIKNNK